MIFLFFHAESDKSGQHAHIKLPSVRAAFLTMPTTRDAALAFRSDADGVVLTDCHISRATAYEILDKIMHNESSDSCGIL